MNLIIPPYLKNVTVVVPEICIMNLNDGRGGGTEKERMYNIKKCTVVKSRPIWHFIFEFPCIASL